MAYFWPTCRWLCWSRLCWCWLAATKLLLPVNTYFGSLVPALFESRSTLNCECSTTRRCGELLVVNRRAFNPTQSTSQEAKETRVHATAGAHASNNAVQCDRNDSINSSNLVPFLFLGDGLLRGRPAVSGRRERGRQQKIKMEPPAHVQWCLAEFVSDKKGHVTLSRCTDCPFESFQS